MSSLPSNIVVRPLTTADSQWFDNGVTLLNVSQGVGLFAKDYIATRIANPDVCMIAAFLEQDLVGLGVAEIIRNFDYYEPFDSSLTLQFAGKTVGSFSTLAVMESLRGQGIGQQIGHLRLAWLKQKQCDVVVGVSWMSGLAHTSNRTFEKLGFIPVRRVDNFYYEKSKTEPFECPGCKVMPCTCAALMYRLDVRY